MVDEGFMAGKQSHKRDDAPSRRESSLASIKSICIDLNCAAEEIQSPKHEHFSIRGYVSETRKTDMKECLPFGGNNLNLAPMSVPKFRWWQCSDCAPGDDSMVGENIAENEPEKASSDIDAFSSLPPRWKRKPPSSYVKKINKNVSLPQPIEEDELPDLNAPQPAAKTRCPSKRNLDEEMAPVDKKLKGPVIEISDSDSEKENRMPTIKKQISSGRNTGIPDLNEPFVEPFIVELLAKIRHERAHNSSRSGFSVSSGPLMPGQHRMIGLSSGPSVVSRPTPTRKNVTFDLGLPGASKVDAKNKTRSSKRYFPQGRMPPRMGSSRAVDLAGPSNLTAQPSRSNNLNLKVCTVNRNPADFSVPDDERNAFMINGNNLKLKNRNVAQRGEASGSWKQRAGKYSS